jgi:hypothetical protein
MSLSRDSRGSGPNNRLSFAPSAPAQQPLLAATESIASGLTQLNATLDVWDVDDWDGLLGSSHISCGDTDPLQPRHNFIREETPPAIAVLSRPCGGALGHTSQEAELRFFTRRSYRSQL